MPPTRCFFSLCFCGFFRILGDRGGHLLQRSPDTTQRESSLRSDATCVVAAALAAGSCLYPPLICVCAIRCSAGGAVYFHSRHLGVEISGKNVQPPAAGELREGGPDYGKRAESCKQTSAGCEHSLNVCVYMANA